MNISNEKVIEVIKGLPVFQDIFKQAEEKEAVKNQRMTDIQDRLELLENRHAEISKRQVESLKNAEKVKKCKQALQDALEECSALARQCIAEDFLLETRLGTLENRLRKSAPQAYYDRLEEIEEELQRLYGKNTFNSDINVRRGVCGSKDFRDTRARAEELRCERDVINKKIFEEYGLEDTGDAQ